MSISTSNRIPSAAAIVLLTTTLALSGCAFLEPQPTPTPTPRPTVVIDTSTYIGTVVPPAGTVWSGTDTGGDLTTFTLHKDGSVAVGYGDQNYDYPGDTWRVDHGVLKVEVYLNDTDGLAEYVGTYDPDTQTITASMRTTTTAKELAVTLTQR